MNIIINGINGRMGRIVLETVSADGNTVVAGFDKAPTPENNKPMDNDGNEVPVFTNPSDYLGKADVIIDFSHYSAIPGIIEYATVTKTPIVVATTALEDTEEKLLTEASKEIPVFHSANMSLGINVMAKMSQAAAPALKEKFNVDIIEKHHNQKADSPSGTALLLANALNEVFETKKDYIYGRHSKSDECKISDMGIHAVRGGTLPGQHTIIFMGPEETIEITHTAYSRSVFAQGAAKAAVFIKNLPAGYYTMNDLIG